MSRTLRLLLRFRYFSRLKSQQYKTYLGDFSIACSEQQSQATSKLFDFLTKGSDQDGRDDVLHSLVHDLLVSLVHHSICGAGKMECPTDQSLFLISLRFSPEGDLQFQPANQLTRDCAILQYWFFSIVAQIARLESSSPVLYSSEECHDGEEVVIATPQGSRSIVALGHDNEEGDEEDEEELEEEELEEEERSVVLEGGEQSSILK